MKSLLGSRIPSNCLRNPCSIPAHEIPTLKLRPQNPTNHNPCCSEILATTIHAAMKSLRPRSLPNYGHKNLRNPCLQIKLRPQNSTTSTRSTKLIIRNTQVGRSRKRNPLQGTTNWTHDRTKPFVRNHGLDARRPNDLYSTASRSLLDDLTN